MRTIPPLAGLKVIDFSQAMSGPTCTMLLADFGAEVIKVEPLTGDNARKWGSARYGQNDEFSSQYLALNRNKKSIAVDLKHPDGLAMVQKLVASADVVVENFKPGVLARLGLGYDAMAAANPRLVFCSISGFGQTGPLSDRPGYDQLMQAYAGLLSVTGEPDRTAVRIGPSAIDMMTGAHAAFGILAALRERDHSGRGQLVDTSLYESAIHMMSHMIVDYTGTQKAVGRTGPYFPFLAPYGIFMAADREFYIGVANQSMWGRLCEALEMPELLSDARFLTNRERAENQRALYDIIEPVFRSKAAAHWVAIAEQNAIPTSLICGLDEVVKQEQALAREAVIPVEGGPERTRSAGIPIKLSETPGIVHRPPPSLAVDADDVISSLGFSQDEIRALRVSKAIR